ncbi:hypothetical protein C9374_010224 [Naegleria lovaniensis]|uniref:lipoate--protein ligase n=1 Tax=Naegleria lovaniensis TaxID=51637 RepID=A0AA88GC20_NAELO|nr:uncharacterized protein C9374_010224 [Naegleria lovaniensis]KAG2374850.1 hypothetical protein C9374_010224 [Naegleria lovaniensis]
MKKTALASQKLFGNCSLVATTKPSSTYSFLSQHHYRTETSAWFSQCITLQRKPVRVIVSNSNDPYFNLATEDYLFVDEASKQVETLFLWRNDRTVVIGKHQNPYKECNISKMNLDGVNLVRRRSGGGAVYQDLGNSIFTFISPKEDYSKELNFQILMDALKHSFNIQSELSGRNDLILSECKRKISGSAFKQGKDVCVHHGTMLLNLDVNALQNYLTPHKLKLLSKGVASVASRVCNLTTISSNISHESLNTSIIREFCKRHDFDRQVEVEAIDHSSFASNNGWKDFYKQLSDPEWNYGMTPDFTYNIETKFDWGLVDLHIDYKSGKISSVKMFSDSLFPVLVESVEDGLVSQEFSMNGIKLFESWMLDVKIPSLPNIDDASKQLLQTYTTQLCAWMCIALFQ